MSQNGRRRIVITGIGMLTPLGNDVESTWEGLIAGRSGAAPITQFDASDYGTTFACEVKDFDAKSVIDHKKARRMDRFAHLIVAAAREAEADSGLDIASEADRIGAGVATGIGGLRAFQDCYDQLRDRGPDPSTRSRSPRSSPTWAPPGSRWSSARRGRSARSARPAPRRTWRSATAWTRSGSAARTSCSAAAPRLR